MWCGAVRCGVVWYDKAWYGMVWYSGLAPVQGRPQPNKKARRTDNDPLFYEKIKAALLSKVLLRRRLLCLNLLLAANLFLLLCVRDQELRGGYEHQPMLHRFTA